MIRRRLDSLFVVTKRDTIHFVQYDDHHSDTVTGLDGGDDRTSSGDGLVAPLASSNWTWVPFVGRPEGRHPSRTVGVAWRLVSVDPRRV